MVASLDHKERPYFARPPSLDTASSVGSVPDISHPATKGCLLALARELWDAPRMLPETRGHASWVVYPHRSGMLHFAADSEGIALARAIMEAPCK